MKRFALGFLKILAGFIVLLVCLYVILYFVYGGTYTVNKTVAQDPSIPHISANGATFHAETFGSDTNQVVIVLHGGPGNDYRYLLDLKRLSESYFVVFYDQRGTGLSPRVPKEELTVENMVEDLHAIVKYYGKGQKINIIGHSWGGMLASAYMGRYPETIHKLVLAEPGPLTPSFAKQYEPKVDVNWALIKHVAKCYFQSLHVEEIDDQAQADYFFAAFATDTTISDHPLRGYFCDNNIRNANFAHWRFSGVTSYQLMMQGMQGEKENMNFVKGIENFENKILFLAGDCDVLIGPDFQREQRKLFKQTELVVIPQAGHMMFSDQPEACIHAVTTYFEE